MSEKRDQHETREGKAFIKMELITNPPARSRARESRAEQRQNGRGTRDEGNEHSTLISHLNFASVHVGGSRFESRSSTYCCNRTGTQRESGGYSKEQQQQQQQQR